MLYNKTQCKAITENIKLCDNLITKMWGTMLKTEVNHAYIFPLEKETRSGAAIHMMFVFTPLTVVWLNNERVVVDKTLAKPWKIYVPKEKARWVIELSPEKIREVKIGDYLEF